MENHPGRITRRISASSQITDLSEWDNATSAIYLAVSLVKSAREVLGGLGPAERTNYKVLQKALTTRFEEENTRETYRTSLRNRTRRKEETLPELAQAIRRLARRAYPQAPIDVREDLAKDQFIDALTDFDTRWKIKQGRPKTLNQALEIAVELEAFLQSARKTQPLARNIQGPPANSEISEQLRDIKDKLRKLEEKEKEKERKRRNGCFHCGALDHFRRDCPTAPKQQQRGKRDTKQQDESQQQQTGQPTVASSHDVSGNAKLPGSRA